jgi:5-methylthioadenosine/S-adenosylhomocysteine deaminase
MPSTAHSHAQFGSQSRPEQADTIIFPRWIIPVVPTGEVLENYALVVTGERISAILPAADALGITASETINLPDHALLPGLINCHGHAAMSLLRGYADDLPLKPWLEDHIWPIEGAHMSEEFVRDGINLAIAEMLRSGTTCFSDMYFFANVAAESCLQAGIRCQIAFPIFDFATVWGNDPDDYISKGLALRDDYKHSDLLNIVFGPHAAYTVSPDALGKIATYANELDLPIHIHLHETTAELDEARASGQPRHIQTLNELGLLGPKTQCVHMTDLTEDEIELLVQTGAHVIHCPESNMKLASGICPVDKLRKAGVNVAIGTDGAASNNDLDMFGEMRTAALVSKVHTGNAGSLTATEVLSMATIDGAKAMGRQADLGSLEPGKLADCIAVDLSGPECQPLYNPISQLVYSAASSNVTHSWIAGKSVMSDRQLKTLNLEQILSRAQYWQQRISSGADGE